jgi:hypothetical protein
MIISSNSSSEKNASITAVSESTSLFPRLRISVWGNFRGTYLRRLPANTSPPKTKISQT